MRSFKKEVSVIFLSISSHVWKWNKFSNFVLLAEIEIYLKTARAYFPVKNARRFLNIRSINNEKKKKTIFVLILM